MNLLSQARYLPIALTKQYAVQAEEHLSFWSKNEIIAIRPLTYLWHIFPGTEGQG